MRLSPGSGPMRRCSAPPQGLQADALYTNAYGDYMAGKYDLAMQEFTDYLKYFSNTEFAPNAQYYIADIYYRKADYTNALRRSTPCSKNFPRTPRPPIRVSIKAMCLVKLGRNDSAAREFRDVYARYADINPDLAAKAKAQLREMGLTVGTTAKRGGKQEFSRQNSDSEFRIRWLGRDKPQPRTSAPAH